MDPQPEIADPTLRELVGRAYRIFRCARPTDLAVCTACCMDMEAQQRALDAGQPNVTLNDLREWYGAAFDPAAGGDAMRWVLPRTLEFLAAGSEVAPFGCEVTLRRLGACGYPDECTREEVDLIEAFAIALVAARVETPDAFAEPMTLDECLCMFALGGIDLGPVTARLDHCSTAGLAGALCCGETVDNVGRSSFWEPGPGLDAARGWYLSEDLENRMILFGFDEASPEPARWAALLIAEDIRIRRPV